MPEETCTPSSLPKLPHRVLPFGTRVSSWPVSGYPIIFLVAINRRHLRYRPFSSPKPGLPPPEAYEPPPPPTHRELGPPPPGYGRYADFGGGAGSNTGMGPGGGGTSGPPGPRRNIEDVVCFKVCFLC